MGGTTLQPRDVIDLNFQPGGVRVEYSPLPKDVQPNIEGMTYHAGQKNPKQLKNLMR